MQTPGVRSLSRAEGSIGIIVSRIAGCCALLQLDGQQFTDVHKSLPSPLNLLHSSFRMIKESKTEV